MKKIFLFLPIFFSIVVACCFAQSALVLQSDFGTKDGAVASMKGVAYSVDSNLRIFDLTHEIPPFNIWQAAYRLNETAKYWPEGTVFVSVVDPGVGTARKSVVLKTQSGHFFVTPDNGTLTLVVENLRITEVREIDEKLNRLPGSEESHTFHGRDVYAYTGALLASGQITFEQVGPLLPAKIVSIPYFKPRFENGVVFGAIPILDIQFGNIWTNIDEKTWLSLGIKKAEMCAVQISHDKELAYKGKMPFVNSFGDVAIGKPLLYLNSQMHLSIALNQGSFAKKHGISSGPQWRVSVTKLE